MSHSAILIKNGFLITLDPQRRVLDGGAVLVEDDRISAVGDGDQLAARRPDAEVIDAARKAVLPGLIDGHAHAGHGLIKTLGAERSDLWYQACESVYTVGSDEDFWYAEAQLAALERLRFGVTTGVSLLGGGDSIMRTDSPDYAAAHCEAVSAVGTRSVVAVGPTRPPFPRRYARWTNGRREDYEVSFERQLASCRAIIERWHRSQNLRLHIAMLTPTLRREHVDGLSPAERDQVVDQTRQARDLGREFDTVFTQDGHTRGSVKFAHDIGILGPQALLSHSTELSDEEIAICRDTDTRIAHNPSAVASILGRCPVPELLDAGVTVCLGSDGTAPDRSGDMFRHMQQCMHYHRRHFRDPLYLPPGKVLEMATIDAAKALGLEREIGSLEAGKKADLILVDLARPHLYPLSMPLFQLIYFANGNDVDTVIVDGKVALRNGVAQSVDENAVLVRAQRAAELMLERNDLQALRATPDGFWGHSRYPQ